MNWRMMENVWRVMEQLLPPLSLKATQGRKKVKINGVWEFVTKNLFRKFTMVSYRMGIIQVMDKQVAITATIIASHMSTTDGLSVNDLCRYRPWNERVYPCQENLLRWVLCLDPVSCLEFLIVVWLLDQRIVKCVPLALFARNEQNSISHKGVMDFIL